MTYTWRQSVAGIEMAALLCQSPAAAQSAEKAAPAAESSAAATSADQTLREELETLKQRLGAVGEVAQRQGSKQHSGRGELRRQVGGPDLAGGRTCRWSIAATGRRCRSSRAATRPIWSMIRTRWRSA